jgi:hypothetical protein
MSFDVSLIGRVEICKTLRDVKSQQRRDIIGTAIERLLRRENKTNYHRNHHSSSTSLINAFIGFAPMSPSNGAKCTIRLDTSSLTIGTEFTHEYCHISLTGLDRHIPSLFYYVVRIFNLSYCQRMLFLFECHNEEASRNLLTNVRNRFAV